MFRLTTLQLVFILFVLSILLTFQACSSTARLDTEAPPVTVASPTAYQPKLSSISIPVSIPLAAIEEKLNQELQGALYKDDNLNDDNLMVTVLKKGRMTIRAEQDKLYFSVPLQVHAKGRWNWEPCKACPSFSKTEATSFDMVVRTESRFGLTDDYKVNTITSGNFEWGDTKPYITLGPIKIGLTRFIEPAMKQQMNTIARQLDKEIQNRLNLRQYVADTWVQLQQPVKLDDQLNAWLTVKPQEVRMAPLYAHNGSLHTRLGISSFIHVNTNGKPQAQVNKTLPRLIIDSRLSDDIQIGLTATVPYTQASNLMQQQVANQTYTFDDGKSQLTVKDAAITPSGEQLVLMLAVDGKTKAGLFTKKLVGKVYLRGTPYYDAQTASIKLRDVDYDLHTKDMLLNTASWLAKNKFKDMIQSQVNIPVQSQLTDVRNLLQQTLNQSGRLHESVLLRGAVSELALENIYLSPAGIQAVVNARGNLTATIDKL
ncbi:DUF4403 family protein [Pontibacter ramchanderi]|uniref:Uncharacterized protein DUF4403 n=1 Tax=Pontibacter ramchanderi TaxID=1179743 RepID=A0A2N3UC93_9BACT|nr:DUF4403 family protein [Pontibacter ramchanderi]PKV66986.1 uncharacterized protein DUF4403 [Pontibacter ramchanderi]